MLSVLFHSAQDDIMLTRKIPIEMHLPGSEPTRSEKNGAFHMQKNNKSLSYLQLLQLNSERAHKTKHYQARPFFVEELTKL